MNNEQSTQTTIGNNAVVKFVSFRDKSDNGKVDTGATTSSLHATNIKADSVGGTVTFDCPSISDNSVTLDLAGVQEVHSANHDGDKRATVKLDVIIDGVNVRDAEFNLNDRSNMDSRILIGQNILKAGNFVVDPNKGTLEQGNRMESVETPLITKSTGDEVEQAVRVLLDHHVTLRTLMEYVMKIGGKLGDDADEK